MEKNSYYKFKADQTCQLLEKQKGCGVNQIIDQGYDVIGLDEDKENCPLLLAASQGYCAAIKELSSYISVIIAQQKREIEYASSDAQSNLYSDNIDKDQTTQTIHIELKKIDRIIYSAIIILLAKGHAECGCLKSLLSLSESDWQMDINDLLLWMSTPQISRHLAVVEFFIGSGLLLPLPWKIRTDGFKGECFLAPNKTFSCEQPSIGERMFRNMFLQRWNIDLIDDPKISINFARVCEKLYNLNFIPYETIQLVKQYNPETSKKLDHLTKFPSLYILSIRKIRSCLQNEIKTHFNHPTKKMPIYLLIEKKYKKLDCLLPKNVFNDLRGF